MELNKYGKLAKKYLEEYKPFKFSRLVMNGSIMDYLYDFQDHLNGYANLIEFELRQKYTMPSEKIAFWNKLNILT